MLRVVSCLTVQHDWRLVVLAGAVCFLTSLVAVNLFHRAGATTGRSKALWLATTGAATGYGIWATHFIAMLAYSPGLPTGYDVALTMLSLLAAAVVTGAGFTVAARRGTSWAAPAGGALVGLGVAAMHYTGMSAVEVPGHMSWSADLVVISIASGVVFGVAALVVAVRSSGTRSMMWSASLLTLAIVAHHFTAMGAVEIMPDPTRTIAALSLSPGALAMTIASAALAVLGISLISARAANARQRLMASSQAEISKQAERLGTALANMSQGLCMFDADQRLAVCNEHYARIYGLSAEQVRPGTTLQQILEYRVANGLYSGSAPEEYIRDQVALSTSGVASNQIVQLSDGRFVAIACRPMAGGGWVATHEDVTERQELSARLERQHQLLKGQEEQLRAQHLQLDAALNNMVQGLAMFDAEGRIVVANARYAEMYGLPLELAQPGTEFRRIVACRVANGDFGDMTVDDALGMLAGRMAGKDSANYQIELAHGRCIAVSLRRMADGGLITTHQDITELKSREQELSAQKLQFEMALTSMSQGLCVFDAEQRLVICNEPYLQIYGLSRASVRPGMTVREILELRIANGIYAGTSPEAYLREREAIQAAGQPRISIHHFPDGRIIELGHHPIPGGGWIASHNDITERRSIEVRLEHAARHDALTNLPNRVLLREQLEQTLLRLRPGDKNVAVLWLELDRFKEVNNTLGLAAGDALLKSAADRLRALIGEDDLIARLSGDEFAVAQVGSSPEDAALLAARMLESLSAPYECAGHEVETGASIGIAMFPSDGNDPDQLLKNADLALDGAKTDGRGTYRFFEYAMNTRMQMRRELERDLRKALKSYNFQLEYQPLLDLATNEVSGCEALLRWNHPERGRISPAAFIPVAEATGLIVPIGEWALREACAEAATWPGEAMIAVNLSAVQFRSRLLVQTVVDALNHSGLSPRRLELEITESVLLDDSEGTLCVLRQLRDLGVRIALDDFGTGYSSLSYLRSFPFHKIKIDRCFIADLSNENGGALAIFRAVVQLGASLGMAITAEGVETAEQLAIVRAEGCSEAQGYLFSPPRSAADIRCLHFSGRAQAPVPRVALARAV